ncbi:unnamed protein product [Larinioides sclopetarius]|uniref:Uncharacterized protein n=1 Tax=Larinioides sclopetarius TaxID=280406 RepID=A0AAV1ZW48_9ARAC
MSFRTTSVRIQERSHLSVKNATKDLLETII